MMANQEVKFLRSWTGEATMFVIYALFAYAFISLALDSAKTIEYLFGILFLVLATKNLIGLIKKLLRR